MAFVSQFNQLPCKTLALNPPQPQLTSKPSIFPIASIGAGARAAAGKSLISVRPSFKVRAVLNDDEWGEEKEEKYGDGSAVAVAEEEEEKPMEPSEIYKLKKALVDSFYGTDRGLRVSRDTRAEIVELITQLESKNPTPAPTEALTLLNGKWILQYTSFSGLFPLLSRNTLPLVKVEEISQTIDSENLTVQNSVQFSGPLATTSITTNAKFEVRSPLRVHIKFEEGVIGTPQLTDSIVIPDNVDFLGQKIDLSPFNGIISSIQDTASNVAKTISSQPPLKFSISNTKVESWLLTTYLDEDLRISRGDGGSVFVLLKEGSALLSP
ncbi:chromoplast-specific carotenoid-associated protein, chromoplastic [Cucumis melo var. makuwa]|uniref:Chromoplast-specific carotenoid-associated protein, chromoplastic n=2 Tax=Cucumis melo TaxID=3656 RepID=A0A1S3B0U1_CUCME|nr:chromoplast-specific carotenoid-associated protein, chromoplastic isoform X1 [Cucumis melo]TYK13014.1 chromoplast-specific carotenoid-associated protein, chromoplastic [Cucumis melo var. makuwa]